MPARSATSLLVAFLCFPSLTACDTGSNAASHPKLYPTVTPSLRRHTRTVLNGFSTALVHHNVRRARSFLSPRYFRACNHYLRKNTEYLRCPLDDTPLPVRYHIEEIDYATPGSKELITEVTYFFPNGHYQPFYLNLLPGSHGLWIDSGGIPQG
jgi:hypothetical protein